MSLCESFPVWDGSKVTQRVANTMISMETSRRRVQSNHGTQFDVDFSNWRITSSRGCQTKYGVPVGQGIKLQKNTGTSLLGQQVDPNSLTCVCTVASLGLIAGWGAPVATPLTHRWHFVWRHRGSSACLRCVLVIANYVGTVSDNVRGGQANGFIVFF